VSLVRATRTAAAVALPLAVLLAGALVPLPAHGETALAPAPEATVEPVDVAMVLPLTVQSTTGGFLDAVTLAGATGASGSLRTQLDAVAGSDVTLAVDPLVIASVRALGAAAPEEARRWLADLDAAPNPSFALTFADSDMTAPLQAGSKSVLQPMALDFALDPVNFADAVVADPGDAADPAATPPAPDVAPPLPSSDELVAWDHSLSDVAWPRADTVIRDDLDAIHDSGYTTTLLSSRNVERDDAALAATTVRGGTAVVTDEVVSSLVDRALHAATDRGWKSARKALTAALSTYLPGSSLAVTLDRAEPVPSERLRDVVDLLESRKQSDVVGLDAVLDTAGHHARLMERPQSKERVDDVRRMLAAERADDAFAEVATDPERITGERRARLLSVLSAGAESSELGWRAVAAAFVEESDALRASVSVARGSDTLLLADRASIYLSVDNGLDQAVTVYITVRPLRPLLRVEAQRVPLTIEPHSQRKASIPVQSLANGEVELAVTLEAGTGVDVGSITYLRTTVRAGWETPVTIALAALIVAIFAFGLVRTVARRRTTRDTEQE
jgi:hypothetical protein